MSALFIAQRVRRELYLNFNQLLDSINDPDMFSSLRTFPDNGFIASAHPTVLEGLPVGLVVVEVAQYYAR